MFIRVFILISLLCLCFTVKRPSARKRPRTNNDVGDELDRSRSLSDWLHLPRSLLNLACNRYHLVSTGSFEMVANRLFNFFNDPNTNSLRTSEIVSPSLEPINSSTATIPAISVANSFTANPEPVISAEPVVPVASIAEIVRNEVANIMGLSQSLHHHRLPSLPSGDAPSTTLQNVNNLPNNNLVNINNLPSNSNILPNSRLTYNFSTAGARQINFQDGASNINNNVGTIAPNNNLLINNIPIDHLLNRPGLQAVNLGSSSYIPAAPARVLNQIRNREYINFNNLLPSAVAASSDDFSIQINTDNNEYQVSSGSTSRSTKNRPKVRDLNSWLAAWNTFIRCTTYFHPHLKKNSDGTYIGLFYILSISNFALFTLGRSS